jgi:hypothetical protein
VEVWLVEGGLIGLTLLLDENENSRIDLMLNFAPLTSEYLSISGPKFQHAGLSFTKFAEPMGSTRRGSSMRMSPPDHGDRPVGPYGCRAGPHSVLRGTRKQSKSEGVLTISHCC